MAVAAATIASPCRTFLPLRGISRASHTPRACVPGLSSPSHGPKLLRLRPCNCFVGISARSVGFYFRRRQRYCAKAENGDGETGNEVDEARGESTMPDRFRYLYKEVPEPPVRWPWFIALAFFIYAWRTVWWELRNWKNSSIAIICFMGDLMKLIFALILQFIGHPITSLIRCIETLLYIIRAFYSSIVALAPVRELMIIIALVSAVLAIAEAAAPGSVDSQSYLLTLSGLIGFAAVKGIIPEPLLWVLLFGLFGIARFIKKRDHVSSALPGAALMAAIGEPWVRVLVLASYTALAIVHHSKVAVGGMEELQGESGSIQRLPFPLVGVALAIGICVAANWAGYRHLTWMIV